MPFKIVLRAIDIERKSGIFTDIDPQTEIPLIWYGNKGGLEDRVFRIGTERSSATSLPEPRTSHNISNVEILEQDGGVCRLRFNWLTFSYRYKTVDTYFGTSFYTVDTSAARPVIKRKKVILKNDYIHHVVDTSSSRSLPRRRSARRRAKTSMHA